MVNLSQQKRLAASVAGVGQRKSKSDLNWTMSRDGKEREEGMLERDIIWRAHDVLTKTRSMERIDGFVDGLEDGREMEENETHKTNTNSQSGSTPRRLPRSDRPTLDLVSESSSRTVTCMSPLLDGRSMTDKQHRQAHRRPLPSTN